VRSVCQPGLSAPAQGLRYRRRQEPEGGLLGQCSGGKLLSVWISADSLSEAGEESGTSDDSNGNDQLVFAVPSSVRMNIVSLRLKYGKQAKW